MTNTTSKKPNPLKVKNREAGTFTKRIGHTTYRAGVHFSDTNNETAQDKILRLVKNEEASEKKAGNS